MLCGFRPVWLGYPVGSLQTVDWSSPLPSLGTTGQLAYFTRVPGGSSQPRFHWICALAERQIDIELVLRWLLRLAVRDGWLFSYDWHLIYLRWPKCMGRISEDLRIFVTTVTVTAVTKIRRWSFTIEQTNWQSYDAYKSCRSVIILDWLLSQADGE